jgi:hypothetical protein
VQPAAAALLGAKRPLGPCAGKLAMPYSKEALDVMAESEVPPNVAAHAHPLQRGGRELQ